MRITYTHVRAFIPRKSDLGLIRASVPHPDTGAVWYQESPAILAMRDRGEITPYLPAQHRTSQQIQYRFQESGIVQYKHFKRVD